MSTSASTIKEMIQGLAESADEPIIPSEFDSLILDDQQLNRELTGDDKKYLEEFVNVELLSFSNTGLTSLANLPELPELKRIELNGNGLGGSTLKELLKYKQLHTIKFADNNVTDFGEVEALKDSLLGNLSFAGNPIAELPDYRDRMFELLPELELLDGKNQAGEEIESDEDIGSEDDYGEEGEQEIDEETRQKLREQGFDIDENGDDDEESEFDDIDVEDMMYGDEDGEDDYDDEDEEPEEPAPKRQKK